jgi:hypothetical protein
MKVLNPQKFMDLPENNISSLQLEESEFGDGTTLAKDDSEHSAEGEEEEKDQMFFTAKHEDSATYIE